MRVSLISQRKRDDEEEEKEGEPLAKVARTDEKKKKEDPFRNIRVAPIQVVFAVPYSALDDGKGDYERFVRAAMLAKKEVELPLDASEEKEWKKNFEAGVAKYDESNADDDGEFGPEVCEPLKLDADAYALFNFDINYALHKPTSSTAANYGHNMQLFNHPDTFIYQLESSPVKWLFRQSNGCLPQAAPSDPSWAFDTDYKPIIVNDTDEDWEEDRRIFFIMKRVPGGGEKKKDEQEVWVRLRYENGPGQMKTKWFRTHKLDEDAAIESATSWLHTEMFEGEFADNDAFRDYIGTPLSEDFSPTASALQTAAGLALDSIMVVENDDFRVNLGQEFVNLDE